MSRWDDPEADVLRTPLHSIPLPLALRQGSRILGEQHAHAGREALALFGLAVLVLALLALALGSC